ncbi:hypothetical protein [Chitiniphilus eburneus]|uniref:hypothetical protein n=1 Tax=Chitiniphilus eburneus TaxID=2571148 RepID=UPI0035D0F3C3
MPPKTRASRKPAAPAGPVISRDNDADINVVLGASGSGKTTYVMWRLKRDRPARLLIWDAKGEFVREGYATRCTGIADMVRRVRAAGDGGSGWRWCQTGRRPR